MDQGVVFLCLAVLTYEMCCAMILNATLFN